MNIKLPKIEDAELYFSTGKNTGLELVEGRIKTKESIEEQGYGLRILKDKRIGFSYFVSEKDYESALNNAKTLSKYSEKSGFSFAPKSKYTNVKTYSAKVADTNETELKGIISDIRNGAGKYTKKCRIMVNAEEERCEIENNEGLFAENKRTNFSAYCEAMNGDGLGFSYYSGIDLLKNPYEFGKVAGEMSEKMKNAKKLKTGKYTVVFSPEAIHSIIGIMLPSLSGDWKRRKISKLHESRGKKVISEKITIVDSPYANASGTTPFDAEGIPSRDIALFKKGVLKNFLYNREIAALEEISAEGACARNSFSTKPAISNSNIVIKANESNYDSFEEELREFILVRAVHGVHTSNTTTGDFGIEANIAFLVKNGKKTGARGFIISGNIFNLFNSIIGFEKKTYVYDNLITPSLGFSDVQIVG